MGSLLFWKDLVSTKYPRVLYIRDKVAFAGAVGWGTMLSECIQEVQELSTFSALPGCPSNGKWFIWNLTVEELSNFPEIL